MVVFTVMLSSFTFYAYQILYTPNILLGKPAQLFQIPKGTTFAELQRGLMDAGIVHDLVSFSFLAKMRDLDTNLKPGMYEFRENMTNTAAIAMLANGLQKPVKLTFSTARKLEDLPAKLSVGLELDSADLAVLLLNDSVALAYGFDQQNFISMFLPNTYEVYWTTTPHELLDRMKREYDRFWNEERKQKAANMGMTPLQVSTLASIVDAETNRMDEAATIAGVYINRINRGIPLQADPTLVFAIGDFSIRRILAKDKAIDSPYNTYLYRGLPPGPIQMPAIAAVEAVLNYEDHRYLYFCAKEDFSGYHVFAKTLSEHNINAQRFQQALNRERIYR